MMLLERQMFLAFGKQSASLVFVPKNSEWLAYVDNKLSFFPTISKNSSSTTKDSHIGRNLFLFSKLESVSNVPITVSLQIWVFFLLNTNPRDLWITSEAILTDF